MNTNQTLTYYNTNATQFASATQSVDFTEVQQKFTSLLQSNATILDFGCGAGRDTKAFLEQGFTVEAVDGSEELCKVASEYTGIQVKHQYFQELAAVEQYDGVWACSSILHLPYEELVEVMKKIAIALKLKGYLYTSFKYSDFEGERDGRHFTDVNEQKLKRLLEQVGMFEIHELWITGDVRPGRESEKWLNVILQKK